MNPLKLHRGTVQRFYPYIQTAEYQRKIWAEAEEADMKKVQEEGVKVIHPDKGPFQASVRSVWDEFEGTEIGDLIKQIQEVK